MSKLLFDSNPLVIIPELAVLIGLNESIILQQLHYWLQKSNHKYDGRVWTFNSIPEWCKQFPFLAQRTIERTMASLKSKGLIVTGNYNKMKADRTLWYSINYDILENLSENIDKKAYRQNDGIKTTKCHDENDNLGSPIPEISTETSTEIKKSVSQSSNEKFKEQKTNDGQTEISLKNIFNNSQIELFESDNLKDNIKEAITELYNDRSTRQTVAKLKLENIDEALRRFTAAKEKTGVTKKKDYFKKCLISAILECGYDGLF